MTIDEARGPPTELWADHVPAFNTFVAMSTQWRTGAAGPTGLDYGVLPTVLRLQGIQRKDWPDLFEDLRTMEDAALAKMHEKTS